MAESPPVSIRQANPADLDSIARLWIEFMDFHRARDAHFTRAPDGHERFKEFIAGHLSAPASLVLIAAQDEEVVGYCLAALAKYPPVFAHREYGAIHDLAVTAGCRRRGIGQRLYRAALAWFTELGIRRIEIRVTSSNEVSRAFWTKQGFHAFVETLFQSI